MFQNYYEFQDNIQTSLQGKRIKGKVVAHHPSQNGLVKIRLEGVHDKWPEDCIPWQQADAGFGHGNNQSGKVGEIPPVGAETYSRFLSDNQYHPVYTAGSSSDQRKIPDFTDKSVYPYAYGSIDQGGHKEVVNTKEGAESYTRSHVKGTSVGIDKNGGINHMTPDALKQIAKEVMTQVTGMMKMEGKEGHLQFGEKLILEAANIELRGIVKSTTPVLPGAPGPSAPSAPTLPKAGQRPQYQKDSSGSGSGAGGQA